VTPAQLCARLSDDPGRDFDSHLLVAYSIARFLPAYRIVEIGVDDGSSTLPLAIAASELGGHLDSVDPAACSVAVTLMDQARLLQCWTFHRTTSEDYASRCPPGVDLVLIDGDHSPEGVTADWYAYEPLVRPGGLLLFHDALNTQDFPGIARLIDEEIRPRWQRWECATLPYGWGLTIVRKLG